MRKSIIVLLCCLLTRVVAAEGEFVKNLRPDDVRAAGLGKLSADELAHLEKLVQQFKSGVVVEVQQQAEAKVVAVQQKAAETVRAVEQAAQQKIAAAEARATEKEKAVAAAPANKQPSWFTALLTLSKAGDKPAEAQPLESRLVGEFTGWSGRTVFKLEDGTRWTQQNARDRYEYYPALKGPKVKIVPAAFGGFWLRIDGVNLSVRVVPTELPGGH
jgi:hypothetical protein